MPASAAGSDGSSLQSKSLMSSSAARWRAANRFESSYVVLAFRMSAPCLPIQSFEDAVLDQILFIRRAASRPELISRSMVYSCRLCPLSVASSLTSLNFWDRLSFLWPAACGTRSAKSTWTKTCCRRLPHHQGTLKSCYFDLRSSCG